MRKLWLALAGAGAIAVAVAGVAYAVNVYTVTGGTTSASGKGSLSKPLPTSLKFGFLVDDTQGNRPAVIKQYRIGAEGLEAFTKARPSCTFDQATNPNVGDPSKLAAACRRAFVGSGTIHNEAGTPTDRTQKLTCDVKVTLINIRTGDPRFPATVKQIKRRGGGLAIRIDQYQTNGVDDPSRCPPVDLHEALAAPIYDVKIDGIKSAELRFTVPQTLAHPGGLDNAIRTVSTTIQKKTGKVKVGGVTRTVGYWSAVGRKGAKRTTRVTFIDEDGVKKTATRQR
jgi:hypothetical protein